MKHCHVDEDQPHNKHEHEDQLTKSISDPLTKMKSIQICAALNEQKVYEMNQIDSYSNEHETKFSIPLCQLPTTILTTFFLGKTGRQNHLPRCEVHTSCPYWPKGVIYDVEPS